MHILYISNIYAPEIAAAAARVSELSERWVRAGHSVTVLTGYPNHPTGRVPPAYGRRYLWRVSEEWRNGVRVVRTPLLPAPNRGTARRSFAFCSQAASASLVAPCLRRPDIVIATSPQPLSIVPGLLTQVLRRTPLVFELRDLWPEQLSGVGYDRASAMVRWLRRVVILGYRRATHIVTVSPAYGPILTRDYGVVPGKVSLIPNGVDTARFHPRARSRRQQFGLSEDDFVIGFVGTIGLSQRFGPVLDTAATLARTDPRVQFLLIGDGANRGPLEATIRTRGLNNVRIFGLQPREQMPSILAGLDAALVLLDEHPYFRVALPSKMFELMAMQLPILLMAQGVSADLLHQAHAGVQCGDTESLVSAIRDFRTNPEAAQAFGIEGRRYVEAHFDRDHLAARYLDLLLELAGVDANPTVAGDHARHHAASAH